MRPTILVGSVSRDVDRLCGKEHPARFHSRPVRSGYSCHAVQGPEGIPTLDVRRADGDRILPGRVRAGEETCTGNRQDDAGARATSRLRIVELDDRALRAGRYPLENQ